MNRPTRTRHTLSVEALEPRRLLNYAPFGAEKQLKASGFATDVSVAGNGSYIVATHSAGVAELFRFRATGEQIGQPIQIQPPKGASVGPASVSMDADGDAVVAYNSWDGSYEGPGQSWIYFQRISRGGVVSSPVQVATAARPNDPDSTLEVSMPQVSMDGSGRFFVGWFRGEIQWDQALHFRAYNADGSPRAAEFSTSATSVGLQWLSDFDLSVTPDGNSAAYSIESNYSDSHSYGVFVGRISTTGVLTARPYNVHAVSGRVTSFADGSFAVVGDIAPGLYNWEVVAKDFTSFVQRFDAAGAPVGDRVKLGATLDGDGKGVLQPSIHRVSGGGFVTAYMHGRTLYAQRFSAAGVSDSAGPVDFATLDRELDSLSEVPDVAISDSPKGATVVSYLARDGDWNTRDPIRTRRLTGDIAAIDNRTLYVLGTRRSDAMALKTHGNDPFAGTVFAHVGPTAMKFATSAFNRIEIEGFNGNDRIFNETWLPSTIRGGSGDDEIKGGSGDDLIRGHGGDDDISGNGGNDTLIGDAGRDLLAGNDGDDSLDGGAGNDRLYGYIGRDLLFGGAGDDQLFGGRHDDLIDGGDGNDRARVQGVDDLTSIEATF